MKALLLGLSILFFAALALAGNYGSAYDWESGDTYNWNTYGKTTHIQGNGNMHGFDGDGNYRNYDSGTRLYQNFVTGRTARYAPELAVTS